MYRVLLIESSDTQRFALCQTLREAGYEPVETQDYWQAINLLKMSEPGEFDAVILGWMDYEQELTSILRKLLNSEKYSTVPLIVLSDVLNAELDGWVCSRPASKRLEHGQHIEILDQITQLQKLGDIHDEVRGEKAEPRKQGVNILLLDDSSYDLSRYQRILADAGYSATISADVNSAREFIAQEQFDIAIVDYFILDSKPGNAFMVALQNDPEYSRVHSVVLISSYVDKAVQESLELGAAECLFKTETDALFLGRINALARQIVLQKSADAERRRFEAIISSVGEGVFGVTADGAITFMNPAGQKMLGFGTANQFIGKQAAALIHSPERLRKGDQKVKDQLADAYLSGAELTQQETIFLKTDGHKINVVCSVSPLEVNRQRQGSVVAFRDITERKQMERRLLWQATRDPLTDLYNRRFFEQSLRREVKKITMGLSTQGALLYLDFDQFKYLNDTAGHDAGDKLLMEASQQLREGVRASDDVSRLGGDEFAVILRTVSTEDAMQIAEQLRTRLQDVAYISEDVSFKLSASIGVAMIEAGMSDKDVLANADIACNIAKKKGRNQCHLYSASTDLDRASMNKEIAWSVRLKEALENEEFFLMYQPILPLNEIDFGDLPGEPNRLWASLSHLPDHYEVLIRLKDGDGMISPGAFLPMAERFGLIQEIDYWVIKESLRILEELQAEGRHASFSVNLSGLTLNTPEVLKKIRLLLQETLVPPTSIVFEITETVAIEKTDIAREFIESCREFGWKFALDDFGTGFSSFSQLKHLPVDIVKVDGQFVQDMSIDPIDRAIVIAINDIAHSLGLETIAEYVETRETLELLQQCGIDHAQGFYISKPLREIDTRADSATQMIRLAKL